MTFHVRAAELSDVAGMARLHVLSWQQTYRGLFPDHVLDDPGFIDRRERFWTRAISDTSAAPSPRIAVADDGIDIVGIAMAGAAEDADAEWDRQLYVLYTDHAIHGRGAGAALLDAVIEPESAAALWVADPNPRAQAFYRKHGFAPDGATKVEDGVREIRMVRAAAARRNDAKSKKSGDRAGC